jgi:hypothetical protein
MLLNFFEGAAAAAAGTGRQVIPFWKDLQMDCIGWMISSWAYPRLAAPSGNLLGC